MQAKLSSRALLWQILLLGGLLFVGWWLVDNTVTNLQNRNISVGFDFLKQEAGFDISEHLLPYTPTDSYARALGVGILNTLKVSFIAIIFASLVGTFIGILSRSRFHKFGRWYVELFRNLPLLLQVIFWYTVFTSLPRPRVGYEPLPNIFLNNRGFYFPVPEQIMLFLVQVIGFFLLIWLGWNFSKALLNRAKAGTADTLNSRVQHHVAIAGLVATPVIIALLVALPVEWNTPVLNRFNFSSGVKISPEFMALLTALTFYSAAFIAEVVRSGINAVDKGQWEAARSLNLHHNQQLKLVVLPQALRLIIPPLNSIFLNIIKNSSLAVAIGYPDLVSVVNVSINQTGQALEGIALIMATYLTINLTVSAISNWINSRLAT